jgi:endonuclease-3
MHKKNTNQIFEIWQKNNPQPKTELEFTNNFTLLVAVVLSAQSTDIGVNKATKNLFKIADNPQKMLDLGEEKLKKYISTIGLLNGKAKNFIN